jgi:hypothetical protein
MILDSCSTERYCLSALADRNYYDLSSVARSPPPHFVVLVGIAELRERLFEMISQ